MTAGAAVPSPSTPPSPFRQRLVRAVVVVLPSEKAAVMSDALGAQSNLG